jgi:hypothetical protein
MGTLPIGNLLAGIVATAIGIENTLFIGGGITVITAFWFEFSRRGMRETVRSIYRQKGIYTEIPEQ